MAVLASVALFSACEEEEELGLASLTSDVSELSFDVPAGQQTISLTATRDWSVKTKPDWVAVDPDHGSASTKAQNVTITVQPNPDMDRTGNVIFTIGFAKTGVAVHQKGEAGSEEDALIYFNDFDKEEATQTYGSGTSWPYLDQFEGWKNQTGNGAADVTYRFKSMSARANSKSNSNYSDYEGSGANNLFFGSGSYFVVDGIALSGQKDFVVTFGSERYLNGSDDNTFNHKEFHLYVSGDGEKWTELEYSFANGDPDGRWDLATARFSTKEAASALHLCVISDIASAHRLDDLKLTRGTAADVTIDLAEGVEIPAIGGGDTPSGDIKTVTVKEFLASPESSTQKYQLTGTVSGSVNTQYGNFDLVDETGTVYVYGLTATDLGYGTKNDQSFASLGINKGDKVTIIGYRGSYTNNNTGEKKDEVVYAYFVSKEDGGGDEPSGEVKTVKVSEFIAAPESSTQKYQLTGTVSGSINTQYGNFDLVDETGSVYVYGLTKTDLGYGAKNDQSFASLGIKEGDKITIIGYRGSYGDKIEVMYAYFVSKEDGGGDDPDQPGEVKTVTIAEFNAAPESSTQKYQLTGTVSGSINNQYGNFDLVDETGTVYVYGLTATDLGYGTKNDQSFSQLGIKAGDKITIIGYRGSYGDKIEVMYAYFVSKEDGGGDDPDQPGEVKTVTVAQFNAAEESSTQKYQLTGTVSNIKNTTYGNFDLVDETGTVYVYGLTATELGYGASNDKSFANIGIKEGDKITLIGYRSSYSGQIQVKSAYFVSKEDGGDNPPVQVMSVTVAQFNAASESETQKYQLTGTVSNIKNTTYGNFDLTDETGTVYVYGLTATDLGYGASNDKSFANIGVNDGDKITIIGYRSSYSGQIQVKSAYFVSKEDGGGDEPGGGDDPGEFTGGDYTITWSAASDWTKGQDDITYTSSIFTVSAKKNDGTTAPTVNGTYNDFRAYAKNTITISANGATINKIVFNLSSQGLKRLTDITASDGTVKTQASGDKTVEWTGSATSVTFTVGDTAQYGSDGASKAGQLDFSSIDLNATLN